MTIDGRRRQKDAIDTAAARLGHLEPGASSRIAPTLDYIRVFVGKGDMVGIPLAQLPMPAGFPSHLLHVRRYDMDLVPTPDLMLEFGDRVGVLMPPDRKEEIRQAFRRHREGHGGIQLCVARTRHGDGRPARSDSRFRSPASGPSRSASAAAR